MRDVDPPPPPPPPELGNPAAEEPTGKRPWSRPHLKFIKVNFTANTVAAPTAIEGGPATPEAPFYRSS